MVKIKKESWSRGECAAVNTDITVLIKPSYLVAVRWPTAVTPCEGVKMICASCVVYVCVHRSACVRALSLFVLCMCVCVCVHVCGSLSWPTLVTERGRGRSAIDFSPSHARERSVWVEL